MEKKDTRTRVAAPSGAQRKNNPSPPPSPLLTINDEEFYQRVTRKAYELYQQRGETPGHELEDWVTAERLVHAELQHVPQPESEEIAAEEEIYRET